MFSRRKPEPPKRRNHDLSQFGLTEIPDDFDITGGIDGSGGDSDLEAELAAIASGVGGRANPKPKPKPQLTANLDQMIADSLKDIGSDDDDDADLENDAGLLDELQGISGLSNDTNSPESMDETVAAPTDDSPASESPQTFLPTTTVDTMSLLQQRIEMYKLAEANAKSSGESAKARRYGRGLKTLLDLQKQAKAGKQINVDDIPPEVSVKPVGQAVDGDGTTVTATVPDSPPKVPTRAAPTPPSSTPQADTTPTSPTAATPVSPTTDEGETPSNPLIGQMRARQSEYKTAALQSKRNGDTATALQFLRVVKQFDMVIKMIADGQEVDLSDMPPQPEQFADFLAKMQVAAEAGNAAGPSAEPVAPTPIATETAEEVEGDVEAPKTVLEALQQRLNKYKSVEDSAKAEGNSSKARRYGRIVKQYEDAIKQQKAGRPVEYDELPVPPGFGPLPLENTAAKSVPTPSSKPARPAASPVSPVTSSSSDGTADTTANATPSAPKRASPQKEDLTTRTSGNQQKNNLAEQQMKLLLEKQKEFKSAAIEAKKAGEIDQAKEYLKIYKGFDSLLNAASSGLPVDLSTLPLPPSERENLESSFAMVTTEECDPDDDMSDIGVRIEEQLAKQLMMCKNTRDHHKAMGDVAGMNRFENLAITVQKDLDLIRYTKRKNLSLPKFHYEKRSFNIVHCNTDLTDSELEIVVVRGITYNVPNPKDVDTYVKIEFPLLNDEAFRAKTTVIKNTDSPDYDQRFKVEIQRGNRQFQRIFKRHGVKFEVYSRGGFLRSDTLIGTVNVKLQPLETKCDIHDTFNLMEGRKVIGGKLEIKVRVRNPILTKQMEHIDEKWLVVDG